MKNLYLNFTRKRDIIKHINAIPNKANIQAPIKEIAKLDGGKINGINIGIKPIVRRQNNIKFVV